MKAPRQLAQFRATPLFIALVVFAIASNCMHDAGAAPPKARPAADARGKPTLPHPFPSRRRAPTLEGGVDWLNTARPLELKDLRGKFVVLDFWTFCCINCMHVLPVLKKLEQAYPNELVVIGVHSAKFDGEQDTKNIRDAILRYEIEHPVINDAQHRIWDKFGSTSWPSIRVIDPEGFLVAGHSGEIDFESIDGFFKNAIPYYRERGLLDEKPIQFQLERDSARPTPLRYPGKVLADGATDRLFISDSNHNRIVITSLAGKLLDIIGSGKQGRADGSFDAASFNRPQGMALAGETLYIADTENHMLRKADLKSRTLTTIAGTGEQARDWPSGGNGGAAASRFYGAPSTTALNSPWDLLIHGSDLYIAMAGPHQIWRMPLEESAIGIYAGNGREDIMDGGLVPREPYEIGYSSFAQPSGLASDGTWLYVADSEGSSIRAVPFDTRKRVHTVLGTAHAPTARLFTFGDVDGKGRAVRLQHPLAVAYADGLLYVADTYNNKIKVVDPAKRTAQTLAGTGKPGASDNPPLFDEPAGLSALNGKLYVADTNNHSIRVIELKNNNRVSTLRIEGLTPAAR